MDEILSYEQFDAGHSDILWPVADKQQSVLDLVDVNEGAGAAAVANHIVYSAFGGVTSETNAAVDHLFGFTGRERDDETGLTYFRARYYDAALGQFLSEDPLGFAARRGQRCHSAG